MKAMIIVQRRETCEEAEFANILLAVFIDDLDFYRFRGGALPWCRGALMRNKNTPTRSFVVFAE